MPIVPFEGFKYDQGHAEAMAEAIAATFSQADIFSVRTPDKLAALAIAAAQVINASKLAEDPQYAAERVRAFILAWIASEPATGKPGG